MNKGDEKIIKKSVREAVTLSIAIAFIVTIAVCVAGLIFSLPS
tara:strand:- start:31 stop:159 length:129 start_codon:yes stop_codon:yes gene_type:complete